VNNSYPCYVALLNLKQTEINWNVEGNGIVSDLMYLRFPGNSTLLTNKTSFNLQPEDNVVYMYLGSIKSNNQTATLKWKIVPHPVTPVVPPTVPQPDFGLILHGGIWLLVSSVLVSLTIMI
jgi:hypothetical protein